VGDFPWLWAASQPLGAEDRHRIGQTTALWGFLVLASIVLITALVVWHLLRRGRLIRERLEPPRDICLSEHVEGDSDSAPNRAGKAG
jgi:hypothetical protein